MTQTHIEVFRDQLVQILESGGRFAAVKTFFALVAGAASYLIGPENSASVTALMVLVAFDFVSAIMACYRTGDPIESRRAMKTAAKIAVYGMFVSAAHLTEGIVAGSTMMDDMAVSFLAITELISIMENFGKMGYTMPQKILNKLKDLRGQ